MLDRSCPKGCTQECAEIWDEHVREFERRMSRRIERTRQDRLRAMREMGNSGGHRGSLQPISEFLDPTLWVGQDPPRRRSRMLALGDG